MRLPSLEVRSQSANTRLNHPVDQLIGADCINLRTGSPPNLDFQNACT